MVAGVVYSVVAVVAVAWVLVAPHLAVLAALVA
jgi:hypothetical protein